MTWVLHRQSNIDRILDQLDDVEFSTHIFTLTADEKTLWSRLQMDEDRKTNPDTALDRLEKSMKLNTTKIDTTDMKPEDIVDEILETLWKGNQELTR